MSLEFKYDGKNTFEYDLDDLNLPEYVLAVINALRDNGVEPYITGGFVRDFMLGREPHDADIVVKDLDKAKQILVDMGFNVSDEASSFRVIKVLFGNEHVDVAGFRSDTYDLVSRKPVVIPVNTIEEDVARRDFTINAMAFKIEGNKVKLIDPFHGLEDLNRGIIRGVGNPEIRFLEDPLRILRGIRFAIRYNFIIDPATEEAMRRNAPELNRVSVERIMEEFLKSAQTNPVKTVSEYARIGVLQQFFPFYNDMVNTYHDNRAHHHGENVFEHTLEALGNLMKMYDFRPVDFLAVLLHDIGKPYTRTEKNGKIMFLEHASKSAELAEKWLRKMRMPNRLIRIITDAIKYHMDIHIANSQRNEKLLAKIFVEMKEDPEIVETLIRLAEADTGERYNWARETFNKFMRIKKLPLGELAIKLNIPEQKRGEWIKKVRVQQLVRGINSFEEIEKIAKGIT